LSVGTRTRQHKDTAEHGPLDNSRTVSRKTQHSSSQTRNQTLTWCRRKLKKRKRVTHI